MKDTDDPSPRLLIAEIGPAHGVRGQVKLRLHLDDPDMLATLGPLYVGERGNKTARLRLVTNAGKSGWIGTIDGVTDRTAAEKWRGVNLYIDRDALPDDDTDDGYYVADLVGLTVRDVTGAIIGTIQSVDNFGASDLVEIKPTTGPTFYVPFTDDYVIDVNIEERWIVIQNYREFLPEVKKNNE
jgi:16S rRNA processing protein RimM